MSTVQSSTGVEVQACRSVLEQMTRECELMNYVVRFWDHSTWDPDPSEQAQFTLVLQHPGSLRKMFWPPNDLSVGEAYRYDDFDVEGDMVACVSFLRSLAQQRRSVGGKLSLGWKLWRLPTGERPREGRGAVELTGQRESRDRLKKAVAYHYDISNEFFELWLDPLMQYTCGYFENPEDSVEKGQRDKVAYVCDTLDLKPGERFLDVGCGWGGLVEFAGQERGAQAVGVTLSQAQTSYARARFQRKKIDDCCRVELCDYRDYDETDLFDKIAIVEVLEHGSDEMMRVFFEKMSRLLKPGGLLYVQAITLTGPLGMVKWRKFNQNYVFPDGQLRPVSTILREGENAGFEVRDVESLREHYPLALRGWIEALEARHEEALKYVDEPTYRTYRMYLSGACSAYEAGIYNVHKALFVKPENGRTGMPLRRKRWYV